MRISDWSSDVCSSDLTYVTVKRSYDDWLPAMNLNLYPADNLILRGAIAKVMTRPGLGSLTPGGSVDQFNFRITSGNPFIDPYRATHYDELGSASCRERVYQQV